MKTGMFFEIQTFMPHFPQALLMERTNLGIKLKQLNWLTFHYRKISLSNTVAGIMYDG